MAAPDSKRAMVQGLVAMALAALLVGTLAHFRALKRVDDLIYDALLRQHQSEVANSPRIVLVTIDEESLGAMDTWPWPRSWHGRIIDYLNDAGATAIGYDILFIESSPDTFEDEVLADALSRRQRVVLAAKIENSVRTFKDGGTTTQTLVHQLVLPNPRFREHAAYGIVNLDLDTGQVVRTYRSAIRFDDQTYPSFTTAVFQAAFNRNPEQSTTAQRYIGYHGAAGTFPSIPAYLILRGDADPEFFRNAIVLVGPTFSDSQDFHAIPLHRTDGMADYVGPANTASGVEVHANILHSLIHDTQYVLVPRWPQALTAVILALLVVYLVMFRSGPVLLVLVAILAVLTVTASWYMLDQHRLYFDITYPFLAIVCSYVFVSIPMRQPLVLHTKVGPYLLYEELGHGGMAIVYRARHPRSGQIVALKQMLPQYAADEASLKRFVREIELIRELDHPNIIAIVDHGEVDGQPYYAMEFVQGDTLEDIQKEHKTIDGSNVRRYCAGIARALAQAHSVGVIHRDIKPSNIMLTHHGEPKLTDFGIARRLDAPQLTQTGQIVGTPFYMAPELLKGYKAGTKSDIYSLGATMYHLLAGRPPFESDQIQTILTQVLFDVAPHIHRLAPEVDDELAGLVMQCIEKDPDDRPADMAEVAKRLDPFFTGVITIAPGASTQRDRADQPVTPGATHDTKTDLVARSPLGLVTPKPETDPATVQDNTMPPSDDAALLNPGAKPDGSPRTYMIRSLPNWATDDDDEGDDDPKRSKSGSRKTKPK